MLASPGSKLGQLGLTNQIGQPNSNIDSGFIGQLTAKYNLANDIVCPKDMISEIANIESAISLAIWQ